MEKDLLFLDRILSEGNISEALRSAIQWCMVAIKAEDWELLYKWSAVKSKIASVDCYSSEAVPKTIEIKTKYPYWEDGEANTKKLGICVYSYLDGLHFKASLRVNKTPSGMVVYTPTSNGVVCKREFPN
jgi:hypothetical protein